MFASEVSIARALANAHLGWALGAAMLFVVIAFAALARNGSRMLLGPAEPGVPVIAAPGSVAGALVTGVILSVALGVAASPLVELFRTAATQLGGTR
jgi:hydrogenase-4 component F